MTRIVLFIFFSLIISTLSAQKIELSGGLNRNNFFDFHEQTPHFTTEYNPGLGYSVGLSISDFKLDSLPIRVSLRFDNYRGKIYTNTGGLGYYNSINADVERSTLGIGVYPLNFSLLKDIHFSFGCELSFLVNDIINGNKISWDIMSATEQEEIDKNSEQISGKSFFGLSGLVKYDIKVSDKWYISPQYKYYFGIYNEFKKTGANTKSMRHNFEIGIIRMIK